MMMSFGRTCKACNCMWSQQNVNKKNNTAVTAATTQQQRIKHGKDRIDFNK